MPARIYTSIILLFTFCFMNSNLKASNSDLRLTINLEKSEIRAGEFSIVHYTLEGSDRELLGASVTLQGVKLISNKGYELLNPDSSTTYVFQVLKYNKPVLTKSFTVYVLVDGKALTPNPNTLANQKSEQLLATNANNKSKHTIKKGRPKSLRLNIDLDHDALSIGDSAVLHYRLDGKPKHLSGAFIVMNGEKLIDDRGLLTLKPDSTHSYLFEVFKNDALLIQKKLILSISTEQKTDLETKEISASKQNTSTNLGNSKSAMYTSYSNPERNISSTAQNDASNYSDGRFNIIGGGKYLTYNGNSNSSSSHFIIQVGDACASNDPNLKNTIYLKAQEQLEVPFDKGSTLAEDVFYFENVRIIQRLTPVDSTLNPIQKNTYGSVYKIEYELENYSLQDKVVNFLTLNDFMLDQNDNPRAYINKDKLLNSWVCSKNQMPESINLRLNNSTSKINARCILKNSLLNGPDSIYYGNWQFIHQMTNLSNYKKQEVVDNALLLKWNIQLPAQHKKTISYAYGFSGTGKVDVQMIDANIQFIESTLYFKMGATEIGTKNWKTERKTLLRLKPTLEHIELIGHTDAMGSTVSNIKLSKLRCVGIKLLMVAAGVNKDIISIKPMGEQFADQSILARKKGKKEDRKVVIHYFTTASTQH